MRLQAVRFARAARALGLTPWLAGALVPLVSAAAAALLVARAGEWAAAVVTAVALYTSYWLVSPARAPWRETTLGPCAANHWRYVEIGAVTVLATALLLYLQAPIYAIAVVLSNALLAWCPPHGARFSLPLGRFAPFGKTPYHFVAGFRQNWGWYAVMAFVLAQAALVHNGTLAVVTATAWMLLPVSFYGETEPEHLLRAEVRGAGEFLQEKCLTGLRQHGILAAVAAVPPALCSPELAPWLLLGYGYAALVLLGSVGLAYRSYPRRPNLPESMLFAAAAVIAPALPLYARWSLRGARRRLAVYLP